MRMELKPNRNKKIRKGDKVISIAGNDRGRVGIVQSLKNDKVIVQGFNIRKKHIKKTQQAPTGRIVEMEKPVHISNLQVCVDEDTAVKLKVRTNESGRQLVYKNGDQEVVYRSVKKPK